MIWDSFGCRNQTKTEPDTVFRSGGGDTPEDVAGGLEKVSSMGWQAPLTRVMVHIADAPGHGDFVTANSPARKEARGLLNKLKCETNIFKYIFIKTNENAGLNNMVDAFKVSLTI